MTFGSLEAKLLRLKWQYVCVVGTKMSIEQRANIKFCFKLGKTFTETFQLMQQVYGDNCLSRGRVHEWYTRFKNGREDINDDPHVGQAKFVITPDSIEKVRDFLKIQPKSSLRFMEMELASHSSYSARISWGRKLALVAW